MGELNFNTRQCLYALRKIGFVFINKRHGKHDKYSPPADVLKNLAVQQPRFIMIPRHGELHCQSEILAELKVMGGDALVEAFKKHL